ncbi:MetS family NSS transporter small subunit [Bacillus sp. REN10]|nr:MetS family NSS transporter small subunit [Bacillus sp. REN10]
MIMDGSAIAMMIIGVVIIWGGMGASIAHAVKKAKQAK